MERSLVSALKERVRPVAPVGALTLEQASRVVTLNRSVAQFHLACESAERLRDRVGELDPRLERQLVRRALELARAHDDLTLGGRDLTSLRIQAKS